MSELLGHFLPLQWGAVLGASLAAAFWDLRCRRIPNLLTGPLLLAALLWWTWTAGWSGLGSSLAGCLIAATPYLLLFALAGGGAGDAKLMAAIGAWLGITGSILALFCVALAGGIMALALALARGRLRTTVSNVSLWATPWLARLRWGALAPTPAAAVPPPSDDLQQMPYGPAIFLGICLAAGGTWLCA